jgi:hypothetical protein
MGNGFVFLTPWWVGLELRRTLNDQTCLSIANLSIWKTVSISIHHELRAFTLANTTDISIYMEIGFVFLTPWRVGLGAEANVE